MFCPPLEGGSGTPQTNHYCAVQCTMEVDTSSATTWRVVNIIKEECIKTGNPVEEALICCVLKLIYDNPKNGFDSDLPMDRHAVRRLIGKHFFVL